MTDTTMVTPEEHFGWDDLPPVRTAARPPDRAHVLRLGQLFVLTVVVALVLLGVATVFDLVRGVFDDLALRSTSP